MGSLKKQNGLAEPSHRSHDQRQLSCNATKFQQKSWPVHDPRVFVLFPNNNKCGTHTSEEEGRTNIYWDPTVCLTLTECTHCPRGGGVPLFHLLQISNWKLRIAWTSPFFTHSQSLSTSCQFLLQIHLHWIPPLLNIRRLLILQSTA